MIELRRKSEVVHIGEVAVGGDNPTALIAGPCAIESEEMALRTAEKIAQIASERNIQFIFKGSYDKANRLSLDSPRGVGFERGMEILARIRRKLDIAVISDVHTPTGARAAGEYLDALQIPAFLCRQTDLITEAAKTGLPVNIKKGQFMSPGDMRFAAEKASAAGSGGILLTERGSSFGYGNLVVDFRSIPIMAESGRPVVMDISHSQQRPGGEGGSSGGDRSFIPHLGVAAMALGVDALYIEVHPDPKNAISDRKTQWPLDGFAELIDFLWKD